MKLADDALVQIIDFLRQGLMEGKDVSELLKGMNLYPDATGKLGMTSSAPPNAWAQQDVGTD